MTKANIKKLKQDTGGGCSVCGKLPVINVDGAYWLCGQCVGDRIEELLILKGAIAIEDK